MLLTSAAFPTAFLNEDGHGVVMSSLYSREHVSVFSKPIKNGSSEYELSVEEKEAVENAPQDDLWLSQDPRDN